MKDNNKDFLPTEAELKHYEKCNDGVISMVTVHRLVRYIRQLQNEINPATNIGE